MIPHDQPIVQTHPTPDELAAYYRDIAEQLKLDESIRYARKMTREHPRPGQQQAEIDAAEADRADRIRARGITPTGDPVADWHLDPWIINGGWTQPTIIVEN